MVSCLLQGGLGNQMFQIAAAHSLALRNNDTSIFNFKTCSTPNQGNQSSKYEDTIFKKLKKTSHYDYSYIYNETSFSYKEIPYSKDILLKGYFQSEKYFIDFKKEIIDLFHIDENNDVNNFLKNFNKGITTVHVRRGDYLKYPDVHPTCTIEYYKKAIEIIGDSIFVFLSDDIGWVIDNFKNENFFYSPFNDEVDDFTLMVNSENNIMSNSSFSWWGSYLNRNKNKKIISPKQWFGHRGHKDTQDIIPDNWIQI